MDLRANDIMKKDEIKLDDWQRILAGEVPPEFFIEVILRIAVIYVLLMLTMRIMGKRMAAQLNAGELAALVTLAAAIGVPLQAPDRGLLPAIIIAFIVVVIQRMIARWSFKNEKFEQLTQGDQSLLVDNSVMNLTEMRRSRITRERLFAQLRSAGITNLGQVRKMYLESSGAFSIVRETNEKPGLTLIPWWDREFQQKQKAGKDCKVCKECGSEMKVPVKEGIVCPSCACPEWVDAYV